MRVALSQVAIARSGDKGDGSNNGLVAPSSELYEVLCQEVTVERVAEHFAQVCHGEVVRYELPGILALNFILHDSLGGGGTETLITDAQGKTHGLGILYMMVDVPDDLPIP